MNGMLSDHQRRWVTPILVLTTIALAFVVIGYASTIFLFFGDVILVFFLAWLIAFILGPAAGLVDRLLPGMPRAVAVVIVYAALFGGIIGVTIMVATSLAGSISDFIHNLPTFRENLPSMLDPWQQRLRDIGFGQVDLVAGANQFLDSLGNQASALIGPLQEIAVASLGVLGNLMIVIFLSVFMVLDRDRILAFLFRLVPPAYKEEARLLETSISRAFGGFLRGQAVMGLFYAAVAAATSSLLGLDFMPLSATTAGILQAIPFFGPFVSWAPPVLVAIATKPEAIVPALVLMGIGWFVVMNVIQPRLMAGAVGIHPIVVLGSVLIGSKLAGVAGAIFGIPIAAVLSAFFFYYLGRTMEEPRSVKDRAARLLGKREGRPVRVPREPSPDEESPSDQLEPGHPTSASAPTEP